MLPKLITIVITLLVLLAAGAVILFVMVIAMNGYSEGDAVWGFGVYVILSIVIAILMSTGAVFLVRIFRKKEMSVPLSMLIAVPVFSLLGIGLEIIAALIGVGVAELLRVNY